MATFSRVILTGTPSSGRLIPVHETGSPGTRIHTANAAPDLDELHLWATNTHTAAVLLTVEWGGLLDPGDHLVRQISLPAKSLPLPIATGQTLTGGLVVTAFTDIADKVNISGYVNRVSGQ